ALSGDRAEKYRFVGNTVARTSVPPNGFVTIEKVPCAQLRRSRMPTRPSPEPFMALSRSKPVPESRTLNSASPELPFKSTSTWRAPLCLAALCNASSNTVNRARESCCGKSQGTSRLVKPTSTLCCFEKSRQKIRAADSSPRNSNFDEQSRSDNFWML